MNGVANKAETTEELVGRLQQSSLEYIHDEIETTEIAVRRMHRLRILFVAFLVLFLAEELIYSFSVDFANWTLETIRSRIWNMASFGALLFILFGATRRQETHLEHLADRLEALEQPGTD